MPIYSGIDITTAAPALHELHIGRQGVLKNRGRTGNRSPFADQLLQVLNGQFPIDDLDWSSRAPEDVHEEDAQFIIQLINTLTSTGLARGLKDAQTIVLCHPYRTPAFGVRAIRKSLARIGHKDERVVTLEAPLVAAIGWLDEGLITPPCLLAVFCGAADAGEVVGLRVELTGSVCRMRVVGCETWSVKTRMQERAAALLARLRREAVPDEPICLGAVRGELERLREELQQPSETLLTSDNFAEPAARYAAWLDGRTLNQQPIERLEVAHVAPANIGVLGTVTVQQDDQPRQRWIWRRLFKRSVPLADKGGQEVGLTVGPETESLPASCALANLPDDLAEDHWVDAAAHARTLLAYTSIPLHAPDSAEGKLRLRIEFPELDSERPDSLQWREPQARWQA